LLIKVIVEFATVGKTKDGKIYHHLWSADEITTLLKEHDLARDETGATESGGDRIIV
jgi:20S proteasome subunit alpha 3